MSISQVNTNKKG